MLTASRRVLREAVFEPRFAGEDGQALPFAAETFDVVIANHLLYHVPNRGQAIDEFRRVLRAGGRMYARRTVVTTCKSLSERSLIGTMISVSSVWRVGWDSLSGAF